MTTVGLLHPGAMGASIGAACDAPVLWCSAGRSPASRDRADAAGLTDAESLADLVERSDVVVSVCPPAAALAVAEGVASLGFGGVYVDANAIAPATARRIADRFARFVDGGIVGPPVSGDGTTRLYLSGAEAARVAELWSSGPLDTCVVEGDAGAASAVKMAYATWTKVSGALLLDVRALARAEGIEAALLAEWARSQPGAAERAEATAAGVAPKAWRFVGEMEQIAQSFADAGLPDGFAAGAGEVYRRLAAFQDAGAVTLEEVLAALLGDR